MSATSRTTPVEYLEEATDDENFSFFDTGDMIGLSGDDELTMEPLPEKMRFRSILPVKEIFDECTKWDTDLVVEDIDDDFAESSDESLCSISIYVQRNSRLKLALLLSSTHKEQYQQDNILRIVIIKYFLN